MRYLLYFILMLKISASSFAQDISSDLQFTETQNTLSSPFNIPLYMNLAGEISLFTNNLDSQPSFSVQGHIDGYVNKSIYSKPQMINELSFTEPNQNSAWIEVKRERAEAGLGLAAFLAEKVISVGLVPFKGARQVMVRNKKTAEEKTGRPVLPKRLSEIHNWSIGDQGSFQRFGGVQVSAGLSYAVLGSVSGGIILQNLWSINISKISPEKIILSFAEEDVFKRKMQIGITVANAKAHFFDGKRLSGRFTLNINNEEHQRLYQEAIKGKLHLLEENLPEGLQKMQWHGSERMTYVGIPGVIGKNYQRSEYDMAYEEEDNVLDIKSNRNSGILLPMRNHHQMVFQDQSSIVLFWYSEVNKANENDLTKYFINTGKIIGAKGFDSVLPDNEKIGSAVSQIGLTLNRSEIEAVTPEVLENIIVEYSQRCEEFNLNCHKPRKLQKVKNKILDLMKKKWEDYRDNLGFLLVKEPALIHAYIKVLNIPKKLYFKFLNQKYQSLEGAASIAF